MSNRSIRHWELGGILFIILAGSVLHFLFEWTGYWRPIGWLASVNESTWEHLKLAFWPGLLFALIEYPFIARRANNFWIGKTVGLVVMPVVIVVVFYGYTAVAGQNYLVADIGTFVLAVLLGQWASYETLTMRRLGRIPRRVASVMLVALTIAFALLSYFPPHWFLFRDPRLHGYGILQ